MHSSTAKQEQKTAGIEIVNVLTKNIMITREKQSKKAQICKKTKFFFWKVVKWGKMQRKRIYKEVYINIVIHC